MSVQDYTARHAWSWRQAIADSDLEATTKHVLLTLSLHMNEVGENCYPSINRIARETGRNRTTVITHITKAIDAGWIAKTDHGFGGQNWRQNHYIPLWPGRDELASNEPGDVSRNENNEKKGGRVTRPASKNVVGLTDEGGRIDDEKVVASHDPNIPENIPDEIYNMIGDLFERMNHAGRSRTSKQQITPVFQIASDENGAQEMYDRCCRYIDEQNARDDGKWRRNLHGWIRDGRHQAYATNKPAAKAPLAQRIANFTFGEMSQKGKSRTSRKQIVEALERKRASGADISDIGKRALTYIYGERAKGGEDNTKGLHLWIRDERYEAFEPYSAKRQEATPEGDRVGLG